MRGEEMQKITFRQRFQYWFDNYMSRGTPALLGGLFVLAALIIVIVAVLVQLTGNAPQGTNFLGVAWMGLLRTLDSGTMGGDTGSPFFLFMMLVVTFGGVFVVSALIGIINNGLEDKLDELRKGRSMILESEHTVILGWSPQVFTIISELAQANANRKQGAVIAILADQDKVEMEDAIRERIPDTKNTKVICRSGSPIDLTDLELVSPHTARSIIVLPEGGDPDTHVIKSVLALTNNPNRREEPYLIVTQIRDPRNMDVVNMLGTHDHLLPILTNDLIARVVAQTSRQSGLSVVYTELMNFGGDEIYFSAADKLVGKTYGEALLASESATILGLRRKDGAILMNPPMDTLIAAGDQVFALAEDDDKVDLSATADPGIQESLFRSDASPHKPAPEKCLILGWNRSGATIVRELDHYVPKGSQVTVVSDQVNLDQQIHQQAGKLVNQKVVIEEGDTTDRALLNQLKTPEFDHVIVLAYDQLEAQEADAKTLVTLLHLRDIAEKDSTPFSIVSEHLVSLMTSQLSENRELFAVFNDIFDPEGSEIYLKPISDYVVTGQPVNFYTVVEAARRRAETAIGYRLMSESHDASKSYGVHTNPKKSALVTFSPEDKVVVIAEE